MPILHIPFKPLASKSRLTHRLLTLVRAAPSHQVFLAVDAAWSVHVLHSLYLEREEATRCVRNRSGVGYEFTSYPCHELSYIYTRVKASILMLRRDPVLKALGFN